NIDAPLGVNTEIKLHSPALLPEHYCPDVHERLVLYKRLAACETAEQINEINEELIDRFGLPETAVNTLIDSHRLRLLAKALGIVSVEASPQMMLLQFTQHTPIDPSHLIGLMQSEKTWRMVSADKLRIDERYEEVGARIDAVRRVLHLLKA
ncbi:MAG: transcription-repair coupling factor, partial [Neisseriaceae bacterium]|nr:transcription-repair coupling factor [Neisseriaceae bacterium]